MPGPIPTQQVPRLYHRRVGDIIVTALHDGYQDSPIATVKGIPEAIGAHAARRLRPARGELRQHLPDPAGPRTALVDTGCGPVRSRPSASCRRISPPPASRPDEIDIVLMTHLHPDHAAGWRRRRGAAIFPHAEVKLHADDHAYWHDDARWRRSRTPHAADVLLRRRARGLAPYRDRIDLFTGGEVFPGVTAVPLPGHTPGHTGFMIASGNPSLLIWGDIVHVQELQVRASRGHHDGRRRSGQRR